MGLRSIFIVGGRWEGNVIICIIVYKPSLSNLVLNCTVLLPVPTADITLDAPGFSTVQANVACNLKFTRYVHLCSNYTRLSSDVILTPDPVSVGIGHNNDITQPRVYCPEDNQAWNVLFIPSDVGGDEVIKCVHLDISKTVRGYRKYCNSGKEPIYGMDFRLIKYIVDLWRRHIGVPLSYEGPGNVNYKTPYFVNERNTVRRVWECLDGLFQCADGTCLLDIRMCDGKQDCVDGSDELHCDHVCIYNGVGKQVSVSI